MFRAKKLDDCKVCGQPRAGLNSEGVCLGCLTDQREAQKAAQRAVAEEELAAEKVHEQRSREAAKDIIVTTEAWIGDVERLDIVATEVVLGMNIFRDVLANVRDIFGGRSGAVQNALEEARTLAFEDLRAKGARLGAEAVIAVDVDYHSISRSLK